MGPSLHLVQITDTHLFAEPTGTLLGLVTADSFQAILAAVKSLSPPPDVILLTGDLSQDGSPAAYQYLWQSLAPWQIPTYWIPGNHDLPLVMSQFLSQAPFEPAKSFQAGGWHLILLNSHVDTQVHGELTAASLAWLDEQLQQHPQTPTLVSLHHPPFTVGATWLDGSRLRHPEDLFAVIDRHPQVKLVVFGHIHQQFHQERHHVTYLGTPSTCIQFRPQSQEFSLDNVGPGFRRLWLYPDGQWETEVTHINFQTIVNAIAQGY